MKKNKKEAVADETDPKMSLSGHLKELRNRLFVTLVLLVIAFGVCLYNAKTLVSLFTDMGADYGYQFVYIAPQELLMEHFSVSLIIAIVLCVPMIAWQVWAFVRPGLKKKENLAFAFSLLFGMIFFCIGVFFAYKVSVPYILYFLIHISEGSEVVAQISVQSYISFLITVFLVFGCVFELPVISVVLTWLGILKSLWLKKARKVAVILIFLLSAIITPPDVVSQIMVALPMIALFQLGILLSMLVEKLKKPVVDNDDDENNEE